MDTPTFTAAPAARPPYGGGLEEFHWRIRFVQWSTSAMGIALLLLGLYGLVTVPWMLWTHSSDAHGIDMASLSPEAQEMLLESNDLAERTRWAGYLLTGALTLQFAFYPIFGLWYAAVPWAALRRARRKTADWAASRQASPYYLGGSLWPFLVGAVIWNLGFGLIMAAQPFLSRKGEDPWSTFASYVVWQSIGLAVLVWLLAASHRRRHFRTWRLQVAAVPVLPGETVAFHISRTDGLPLCAGLRLAVTGDWPSRGKDRLTALKAFFRRVVCGDVEAIPDAAVPGVLKGTLRIDDAGLSLVPPPDGKQKGRCFAFLRVRQGWWMKCQFEVPLPAVYVVPQPGRSNKDEQGAP